MSKLTLDLKVPANFEKAAFSEIIRTICQQVNDLSEGRISARYTSNTVAPSGSAVAYTEGDIVWDKNPTVSASVAPGCALNYVRLGWITNVAGSPGTQQELRVLTGGGSIGVSVAAAFSITPAITYLSGDVSLTATASYFDGPSQSVVAGTGTYYASGTVVIQDSSAGNNFMHLKLWDGTTVISSAHTIITVANQPFSISLSGYITNPAGNIKISVRDATTTNGRITFNGSGNSKDSNLTVLKIG